jgi:hypothetical protein
MNPVQEPNGSKRSNIIRDGSRLLLWAGAAAFLVGGKFRFEIKHVNLVNAEAEGILGGALLMLLGAGIGMADKAPSSKQ